MPLNEAQKANLTHYFEQNSLIPEKILQGTAEEKKAFSKRYLTVLQGAYDEELRTFCYLWHLPDNSKFDKIYRIELSDLRHFTINYIEDKLGAPKFYGKFHSDEITLDNSYMNMSPQLKRIYKAIYLDEMNESMLSQSIRQFKPMLILAARFGRVALLKRLLELDKKLSERLSRNMLYDEIKTSQMSLLQIATTREHTQSLNLLLKYGANPNQHSEGTESPLEIAINGGNLLSVCALIKCKATITVDMINLAMKINRLDIALILIKKAPQELIDQTSSCGTTMLSQCLDLFSEDYKQQQQALLEGLLIAKISNSNDPLSLLTCILARGADINVSKGLPLQKAIVTGNESLLCALIGHKATITVNLINFAMETNRFDMAFILIEQVSNLLIDKTSPGEMTMLLRCLTLFTPEVVQQLALLEWMGARISNTKNLMSLLTCMLKRGVDVNAECLTFLPLDYSINAELDDDVIKLLIEHDARFTQKHIVDLIKSKKNPGVIALMIEKSSTDFLKTPTENGGLILDTALIYENADLVTQLIEKGVNLRRRRVVMPPFSQSQA